MNTPRPIGLLFMGIIQLGYCDVTQTGIVTSFWRIVFCQFSVQKWINFNSCMHK